MNPMSSLYDASDLPTSCSGVDGDVLTVEKFLLNSSFTGMQPLASAMSSWKADDFNSFVSEPESPFSPSSPSTNCSSLDDENDYDDDIVIFEDDPATSPDAANYHPVAPPNADEIVARQMAGLSMEDREKILFDIHGVAEEVPETDIEVKLDEFNNYLRHIPSRDALDMAIQLGPDYVTNRDFQVSFLRADSLDSYKAAQRFARHFQAKLDLFGPALLVKDITQDDLDPETLDTLYAGLVQYLPLRDRAGRLVHVSFHHTDDIPLHPKLKRTFYMCMVSNEDEETQRKGRVAVGYLAGQNVQERPRNDWQVAKLMSALPVRMSAVHLCHDTPSIWSPIFAVFKFVVTLLTRLRIREHCGTTADCLLSLQTFGIPNCFPLQQGPNASDPIRVLVDEHSRFWNKRRTLERLRQQRNVPTTHSSPTVAAALPPNTASSLVDVDSTTPTTGPTSTTGGSPSTTTTAATTTIPVVDDLPLTPISTPAMNDVLLGRGKGFYQHTGNIRFRHWIESRFQQYDQAQTSAQKKQITMQVIDLVRKDGGRFLRDEKCGWVVVNDDTARQKVAHVFRSLRGTTSSTTPHNPTPSLEGTVGSHTTTSTTSMKDGYRKSGLERGDDDQSSESTQKRIRR